MNEASLKPAGTGGRLALGSRNARIQMDIAVALVSVIPLLVLSFLYVGELLNGGDALRQYGMVIPVTLVLAILGYIVLSKYPVTVLKLRKYLEDIARGNLPVQVNLENKENDIVAIEDCLNRILAQLKRKVADMEMEQLRLEMQLCQAQKLRAIGTLTAGIAHEINTPIQFVGDNTRFLAESCSGLFRLADAYRGLADQSRQAGFEPELVERIRKQERAVDVDFLRKEVPEALTQSLEGLSQAAEIVRALKDFSTMTEEGIKMDADINRVVDRTITITRNEWKHVADMKTSLDPDLPLVPCHIGDIRQTLVNLIVNASHAVGDAVRSQRTAKGQITVSTWVEDTAVCLAVSDTGTGIPEKIREKIFEPFFTTKKGERGTGQGLAIVRSLITKRHGGTITVDSEVGAGTTFTIRIPLSETVVGGRKAVVA